VPELRVTSYSRAATELERMFYGRLVRELAARRHARDMTQEQLDQVLGVSDGQVAKWEAFDRLPGAFTLMCWCNALDLRLATFEPPKQEDRAA
jgi:transcriptional regulator with XRE-family HTH domain